jgi:DNA-binding NarL/FixJ family response regulator
MTRVLVVDDHSFFRGCLVDLINASGDLGVVGECADGCEVVAAVEELRPDLVVMDVRMPRLSGLEAAAVLQQLHPTVRVVILTSDTAESSRVAARASGVVAYLVKGADPEGTLEALRQAAQHVPAGRRLLGIPPQLQRG